MYANAMIEEAEYKILDECSSLMLQENRVRADLIGKKKKIQFFFFIL